ncbi:MAG: trypsin-like peptidase domain-containing protein [Limosilactobacillus sp.]|uniref:S1C family serine protease n=1 Tax=Limosilactobacillus sp. TaxID=2773925 RepID=UPI002704C460|nr:trypsin-like peptidase domain-containing protein [Limosilactobacillus sp.]
MSEKKFHIDRFWVKVATVGLVSGLIGGGVSLGANGVIQSIRENNATQVPSGSNASGGTKVNGNKANLNTESTKAYTAVQNAVVSVLNEQKVSSSDNSLESMFGISGNSSSSSSSSKLQTASEGSGVIYKKSGNTAYIVTNNHVVSGSNAIKVILSSGKKVEATLVGSDSATDLAVLKINSTDVKAVASFGNSNSIKAGQDVLAIGSPMGSEYANTVTKGIISAKNRTLKAGTDGTITSVIQTDAAINSGNSGGPLINMAGQVIGINSMKLSSNSDGSSVEGMGFSIPSNEVVSIINQLVKNGSIKHPALGLGMIDLSNISSDQRSTILKLPSSVTKGVVVAQVASGSVSDTAGIKEYDVITKIGNTKVNNTSELRAALYKYKVGDTTKITVYRDGSQKTLTVHLTKAASSDSSSSSSTEESGE